MTVNVSARNMELIVRARDHHNATCALGPATEVLMNPYDIDRCGWEDGDTVGGLRVVASGDQAVGTLHVGCPGEENEPELSAAVAKEDLIAVGIEEAAALP